MYKVVTPVGTHYVTENSIPSAWRGLSVHVEEWLSRQKDRDSIQIYQENGHKYRWQKDGKDIFPRWVLDRSFNQGD